MCIRAAMLVEKDERDAVAARPSRTGPEVPTTPAATWLEAGIARLRAALGDEAQRAGRVLDAACLLERDSDPGARRRGPGEQHNAI